MLFCFVFWSTQLNKKKTERWDGEISGPPAQVSLLWLIRWTQCSLLAHNTRVPVIYPTEIKAAITPLSIFWSASCRSLLLLLLLLPRPTSFSIPALAYFVEGFFPSFLFLFLLFFFPPMFYFVSVWFLSFNWKNEIWSEPEKNIYAIELLEMDVKQKGEE